MDGETLYSIGELARRSGLSVKAIRFYSDRGVVPPTDRSPAGYRLYDIDALARLELVRTLRDLGIDLATVQRVLEREITVAEVAAAHAEAVDVQIRTLRLRRAVLRAVAKRGSSPEEMELMHKLAKLSDEERRRVINDFIDEAFGGLDAHPEFVAMMRSAMPELPDDPAPEQVDAWVELAELVGDADFRAAVRRAAEYQAAERASGARSGSGADKRLVELTTAKVTAALDAGTAPDSATAQDLLDDLLPQYADLFDRTDGPDFRHWLLIRFETGNDPRMERYWQLLSAINGWPQRPSLGPVFDWVIKALRSTLRAGGGPSA
jgi:DNA-binding transcriptional MerR regulator